MYEFPQIDYSFMSKFTPMQFVITITFYILLLCIVTDAIVHTFYKIFHFVEIAFNDADSEKSIFKRVMK